jgi:DNA-binding NarL/FixJ family response regulator
MLGIMTDAQPPSTPARHTILLVDDDVRVRHNLILLLRWAGDWDVVGEASDATSALDLATALLPELVLLDRWLADGDGLRLLPQLRALRPPPLVAILTGDPLVVNQAQDFAPEATACLDKMTPPLDLLQTLRGLVAGARL